MSRDYIKLTNGAVIKADNIVAIVRQDINQYHVLIEGAQGLAIRADSHEVDAICSLLNVAIIEPPPKVTIEGK